MIATILRTHWMNLKRDRAAFLVTFLVPLVFFSIFAMIYRGASAPVGEGADGGGSPLPSIVVLAVDLDDSEVSRRLFQALAEQGGVEVRFSPGDDDTRFDRETALAAVRSGDAPVAVVTPEGFGATFGDFMEIQEEVELLYDTANPVAPQAVAGMLQAAAMQAAPTRLMDQGFSWLERAGGGLTPGQKSAIDEAREAMEAGDDAEGNAGGGFGAGVGGLVAVKKTDVRETDRAPEEEARGYPMIAYNASGIGVMFLLFSMAGVGGVLLDDQERGTLERLLTSPLGMNRLLLGNWLFAFLVGATQVTSMFLLASMAFDLELFTPNRLIGFVLMTAATAGAGAAFGMVLATLCKTRAQLGGVSTLVILVMSAAGGSMVPRFIMPKFMETTSLFTFNGWALDGYLKVFWYDEPGASAAESVAHLAPQLAVLTLMALSFLALARLLARRWEMV